MTGTSASSGVVRIERQTSVPGPVRQHQVEDHEIRSSAPQAGERLVAGRRRLDLVAVAGEGHARQLEDVGLVVDDEDSALPWSVSLLSGFRGEAGRLA